MATITFKSGEVRDMEVAKAACQTFLNMVFGGGQVDVIFNKCMYPHCDKKPINGFKVCEFHYTPTNST